MNRVHAQNSGIGLERTADLTDAVDHLAAASGGRVGLPSLLDRLELRARPAIVPRLLGRAVDEAYAWNAHDQRDPVWWPQGITTSAEAHPSGRVAGRRLVVTTSYAKPVDGIHRGSRLTFLDLDTLRYGHVPLVVPHLDAEGRLTLGGLRVHAGGLAWAGDWLHVAATARGFFTCRVDDLVRISGTNGHGYVLPVRFTHRAFTDEGHEPLRHSFLSVDRDTQALLVGEYGRGRQTTRLAQYALDPDTWLPTIDPSGHARPVSVSHGVRQMQGAVIAHGRHHVTASRGPWTPGSVFTGDPGALRQHRWAVPMGPEDLTYWPRTDRLWSHSEHPYRRWVWSMRRSWFDEGS